MIEIHWDFVDGTEISYAEGLKKKDNFTTNCLDFFTTDNPASDVVILSKNNHRLSRNRLLSNDVFHTDKEIRKEHNILKMLKAGVFSW